jgi:hypothetical protein
MTTTGRASVCKVALWRVYFQSALIVGHEDSVLCINESMLISVSPVLQCIFNPEQDGV